MRIVHTLAGLAVGGTEMMLLQLVRQLPGHSHHVVCMRPPPAAQVGSFEQAMRAAGAQVTYLGIGGPASWLHATVQIGQLLHATPPDVVQGWMYHGNLLALALGRARQTRQRPLPVVWSNHSASPVAPGIVGEKALTARLGAPLSYLADQVIYVSEHSRAAHVAHGYSADNTQIIACGTALPEVSAAVREAAALRLRQRLGLPAKTQLIGMLARLDPSKDHPTFLQAAAQVVDPTVHFVLAGPHQQSLPPSLKQYVPAALLPRLHWLGVPDDTQELYAGLTAFTLCSHSESFGMVLLEAMASGTPCVASDVGICGSLLQDVGWVVPVADAGALAQTWRTVLNSSTQSLQARLHAGRQRVQSQYSAAGMAQKFIDLYRRLGENPGQRLDQGPEQARKDALKQCSVAANGAGKREDGQVHGHHQAAQDHGQEGHDQRLQ
jgi:glycosyltransferase involved in cell wall biosynthesis